MKVIGYVRVSTEEQAGKGVSLDAQRAKIRGYCELYDLELVQIFEDAGASGKSLTRSGLINATNMLQFLDEIEGVVVAKLDRLTRSVADLGTLLDLYFSEKYQLFSVSEQVDTRSAAGRLVLNILTTVAQWERETIGERTSAALQHKKRNGEYTGGFVPWGYRIGDNGKLVENPEEQGAAMLAARLRKSGYSLRKIGTKLLERGFRPRRGESFGPQKVKYLIEAAPQSEA